jgi:hypothetical protein
MSKLRVSSAVFFKTVRMVDDCFGGPVDRLDKAQLLN